jgi:isopenicillin-N N-acyltransferase like protein
LIQSHARQCRIDELLAAMSNRTISVADLQHTLSDHTDYPTSICRHPNADPALGFWETVFSVIIAPESREMHITRGTPCSHRYERYPML